MANLINSGIPEHTPILSSEIEVWREIPGFDSLYEVSTRGNVRSTATKQLKKFRLTHGYCRVFLYNKSKQKSFAVHRLVGFAFLPNPESKEVINHKNYDKSDNRIENLEWCTRGDNSRHGMMHRHHFERNVINVFTGKVYRTVKKVIDEYDLKACTVYAQLEKRVITSDGFMFVDDYNRLNTFHERHQASLKEKQTA